MRAVAVGQAELKLFWRNRTALFNSLLVPLLLVPVLTSSPRSSPGARSSCSSGCASVS
jgi:hypothetical protein